MPSPAERNPKLSIGDEDLDDIQTLRNLLELHSDLKREASSVDKRLD